MDALGDVNAASKGDWERSLTPSAKPWSSHLIHCVQSWLESSVVDWVNVVDSACESLLSEDCKGENS